MCNKTVNNIYFTYSFLLILINEMDIKQHQQQQQHALKFQMYYINVSTLFRHQVNT